jgi:hypothetical protein
MIVIKACILYVVSGFGGYATPSCLIDGSMVLSSPDYVYRVDTVPSNMELRIADSAYVEFWTEPTIRIVFGNYRAYVGSRGYYKPRRHPRHTRVATRRSTHRPRIRTPSKLRVRHRVARKRVLRSQKKARRVASRVVKKTHRRTRRPSTRRQKRRRSRATRRSPGRTTSRRAKSRR